MHLVATLRDQRQELARHGARGLVGRRHHLRNHHAGAFLAQLIGQRLRAHERHVEESAAVARLARRPDVGGARGVGADLHHRIGLGRVDGLHRFGHVDRVALHRGRGHRLEALRTQGQRHAVQTGLAVGVVLVEHGDLLQTQVGELAHDQCRLVVVRGAHVKGHAVERLAQSHGAGERGEERCLRLGGEGQRHQAGGCANVAKEGKHLIVQ